MLCACTEHTSSYISLEKLGYNQEEIVLITSYNEEDVKPLYSSYNKKLVSLLKDSRCNTNKLDEYAKYCDEFDSDLLFSLVNKGYTNNKDWDKIKKLAKQKFFILDNLDLYLEYYSEIKNLTNLVAYVNVKAYQDDYSDITLSNTDDEMTVLANKWNYLGDFEPTNLVTINKKYGVANHDQQLKQETYDAFIKMYDAAKKDKINLYITSAYRSYIYQVQIYNDYLAVDPVEVVDTYSSRPGHSDHQTGLACDILSPGYNFDTFESSDAFTWLQKNAAKYGFILRYPKDKEDITGYMYESWHYRYVGEELAKFINENKITYDEYHAYYVERDLDIN